MSNVLLQNALSLSNATSATTTRKTGDRWADSYTPQDYGAVGDGTADDSAALQRMFDAISLNFQNSGGNKGGNKVFFPQGSYKTTVPIYITKTGSLIVEGAAVINNATPNSITVQTNGLDGGSWSGVAFLGAVGTGVRSSTVTFTVTPGSPVVCNWTSHGLIAGSIVVFSTTGTLPDGSLLTGVLAGKGYYVRSGGTLTTNSFTITGAPDPVSGPPIVCNDTTALTGTQTARTNQSAYTFAGSTITVASHNLSVGACVSFITNPTSTPPDAVPSPFNGNQFVYYVVATPTANTFQVSATIGGSAVTISGGSGTQYVKTQGVAFWLGQQNGATTTGTEVHFRDCFLQGPDYGFVLGGEGVMCSENLFDGTAINACPIAGLTVNNGNCLDNNWRAGGISGCGTGIIMNVGSIALIDQCSTSGNLWDIAYLNNSAVSVRSHRTESNNFIYAPAGTFALDACEQDILASGYFIYNLAGACSINACQSQIGRINGGHGLLFLGPNAFDQAANKAAGITNIVNNGSGFCRVSVSAGGPAGAWDGLTSEPIIIFGVSSTIPGINGNHTVTFANPQQNYIDINLAFSGSYSSGGDVVPAPGAYLVPYGGAIATPFLRANVLNVTSNVTLTRAQSGASINNQGAGGSVTTALPSAASADGGDPGIYYDFYVATAQQLEALAQNGMKIQFGATLGGANGNLKSSTLGSSCRIECLDGATSAASTWIVKFATGTWTVT